MTRSSASAKLVQRHVKQDGTATIWLQVIINRVVEKINLGVDRPSIHLTA